MNVLLDAIKFNHDPTSATFDALNLRRNAKQLVTIPEWRRGISVNPEDSPAAYALFETRGNAITIRAKFKRTNPTTQQVEIRALHQQVEPSSLNYVTQLAAQIINPALRVFVGGPLGDVQSRQITFKATGESDFEIFVLQNPRLWELGVGVHDIVWRWQYRLGSDSPWTDFDTSRHRIYTVLRQPQAPWQQTPFNLANVHIPWVAVLEYACRWAATSHNPTEAATLITHRLNQLGANVIKYTSGAKYALPVFNDFMCAEFLDDLRMGTMRLNCTDCATIVTTFTNILGGELWQSRMTEFNYNPIIRIGESEWVEGHFEYHRVAWEEECDVHNDVFDACLQIDGDADPTNADCRHVALLPTDIRFGRDGENLYRFSLVAPFNDVGDGVPEPRKRGRRPIRRTILEELPLDSEELVERAKRVFDYESWRPKMGDADNIFFSGLTLDENSVAGWTPLRIERFKTTARATFIESLWQPSGVESDVLLRINIYEGTSTQKAREWLLHFLALLHTFSNVDKRVLGIGDITFVIRNDDAVAFSLGNLVIALQNVGRSAFAVENMALDIGQMIVGPLNRVMSGAGHSMKRFAFPEGEHLINKDIPLDVKDPDPFAGLPLTYVFISADGFIHTGEKELLYHPFEAGPQEVRVLAVNRNGTFFTQTLPINVAENIT